MANKKKLDSKQAFEAIQQRNWYSLEVFRRVKELIAKKYKIKIDCLCDDVQKIAIDELVTLLKKVTIHQASVITYPDDKELDKLMNECY